MNDHTPADDAGEVAALLDHAYRPVDPPPYVDVIDAQQLRDVLAADPVSLADVRAEVVERPNQCPSCGGVVWWINPGHRCYDAWHTDPEAVADRG